MQLFSSVKSNRRKFTLLFISFVFSMGVVCFRALIFCRGRAVSRKSTRVLLSRPDGREPTWARGLSDHYLQYSRSVKLNVRKRSENPKGNVPRFPSVPVCCTISVLASIKKELDFLIATGHGTEIGHKVGEFLMRQIYEYVYEKKSAKLV